jgi:hypothetical protein
MTGTKKLYVKTYGCQMNVYDSERMAEALGAEGYEQVATPEDADMILLNTCHIREKAAEKVYSELGRFKGLREANPTSRSASRAASRRPRAKRSCAASRWSTWWWGRRPITACPR